jgi:threonine/homoserine/homoserine lactone efflux protein
MLLDAFQTTKNDLKKTALRLRSLKKKKKHLFGKTFLTTLFNPKQRPNPGFEPGYHPES